MIISIVLYHFMDHAAKDRESGVALFHESFEAGAGQAGKDKNNMTDYLKRFGQLGKVEQWNNVTY